MILSPGLRTAPRRRLLRRGAVLDRVWIGAFLALAVVVLVVPTLLGIGERDIAGAPFSAPGDGTLLGTDSQGRDVFLRSLLGMRTSLLAAVVVILAGVLIGTLVGLVAGLAGGWVDSLLMRLTDAALALPAALVALAVAAALGSGLANTLLALAIMWWPWYARIVRGEVAGIRASAFVEAARLGGLGRGRIAVRHVIPGTFATLVVAASLDIGAVVVLLSGLSFLGLGSPPPAAELGAMVNQGLTYWFNAPWVAFVPAVALFLLALLANLAGDALRDGMERR